METAARLFTPRSDWLLIRPVDLLTVERAFSDFARRTNVEWLDQMMRMRVVFDSPPAPTQDHSSRVQARMVEAPVDVEASVMPDYDTVGLRAATWIRRRWGVLNSWEPPVVLNLDALGDTATHAGLTVTLDLEDPTRSVAYVGGALGML